MRVEAKAGSQSARFELAGLDTDLVEAFRRSPLTSRQWESAFRVQVGGSDRAMPPVAGTYAVRERTIVFDPIFPFEKGLEYVATADPARLARLSGARPGTGTSPILYARVKIPPPPPMGPTRVTEVFPSGDTVPANLLKFYIHFSRPMMRGAASVRISLRNLRGTPVPGAFLRLDEELWDPSGRRLTVFLDPGRIKRGLRPRSELGSILLPGQRFTLRIDSDWPDAQGLPLAVAFEKTYSVATEDRRSPAVSRWRIVAPMAGSLDPIEVRSPDALDRALAERMVTVRDPANRPFPIVVTTANGERALRLTPLRAWRAGVYKLLVDAELEDLAGNSPRRLFDVDLGNRAALPREQLVSVSREFRVRSVS